MGASWLIRMTAMSSPIKNDRAIDTAESWMVSLMPSTIHWAYCPVRTTDQSN
jgi:hypothetical protein